MKPTTDGRWAHLACAIWIPGYYYFFFFTLLTCYFCWWVNFTDYLYHDSETCLSDIKKMEPIDGLGRISKVLFHTPQYCPLLLFALLKVPNHDLFRNQVIIVYISMTQWWCMNMTSLLIDKLLILCGYTTNNGQAPQNDFVSVS